MFRLVGVCAEAMDDSPAEVTRTAATAAQKPARTLFLILGRSIHDTTIKNNAAAPGPRMRGQTTPPTRSIVARAMGPHKSAASGGLGLPIVPAHNGASSEVVGTGILPVRQAGSLPHGAVGWARRSAGPPESGQNARSASERARAVHTRNTHL